MAGAPQATFSNGRTQAGADHEFQGNSARSFPLLDQLFGAAAMGQLGTAVAGGETQLAGAPARSKPFLHRRVD